MLLAEWTQWTGERAVRVGQQCIHTDNGAFKNNPPFGRILTFWELGIRDSSNALALLILKWSPSLT